MPSMTPARWKMFFTAVGLGLAVTVLVLYAQTGGKPVDAWCYYGFDATDPYDIDHCFLYSPPILQVMLVIRELMPFEVFAGLLRTVEMIALAIMAGPALGPALFIPSVAIEINAANVNLLLILAVIVGFRYPAAWAFPILTKFTPGIGLLWFAVRKEWRNLAIAVGVTAAIAALSFAIAPWMWPAYLAGLRAEPDESIFLLWWRLPIAAALIVWGARTDRKWAMVVATLFAMPRWYYLTPVILVGLFVVVRFPRPLPIIPLSWQRAVQPKSAQPATAGSSDGRTTLAPSS